MRFEVLNKNPVKLKNALHIAIRYEALKLEHSAPLEAPTSLASPKGVDVSAYVYDDKGHKKESLRAHEIHVASDPEAAVKYETKHAHSDDGQKKIMDLQQQLKG